MASFHRITTIVTTTSQLLYGWINIPSSTTSINSIHHCLITTRGLLSYSTTRTASSSATPSLHRRRLQHCDTNHIINNNRRHNLLTTSNSYSTYYNTTSQHSNRGRVLDPFTFVPHHVHGRNIIRYMNSSKLQRTSSMKRASHTTSRPISTKETCKDMSLSPVDANTTVIDNGDDVPVMVFQSDILEDVRTASLVMLVTLFNSNGFSIRIVGGAVRDMLVDIMPKDIDLATEATPDQSKELCESAGIRIVETGLKHGTITAIMDRDYEITTLRIDTNHTGRHASVDFTKSWKQDALRRDLTFNAMSMAIDGRLYDYFNGREHLSSRRVLFVGDSSERICEDYLRILRYFRFYGRMPPFEYVADDAPVMIAIRNNASGLLNISRERIWMEMRAILSGTNPDVVIAMMERVDIFPWISLPKYVASTPELMSLFMTVCSHSVNPVTRLVSLLDSSKDVEMIMASWKTSSVERDLAQFIALKRNIPMSLKNAKDILVVEHRQMREERCTQLCEVLRYQGKQCDALALENWDSPTFPVNGKALVEKGLPRGKVMGALLALMRERWCASDYALSSSELLDTISNQDIDDATNNAQVQDVQRKSKSKHRQ